MVRRRRRVRFSRAAPRGSPEARTSSNGQDGRIPPCRCGFDSRCPLRSLRVWSKGRASGLHPVDAGSIPAARSQLLICGDRSMVGYEHATLVMGVRFPLTAPREPVVLLVEDAVCKTVKGSGSIPGRLSTQQGALEARWTGGRLLNGEVRVRIPPRAPPHRGVAQPGKSACLGDRRSPVRIRPPRPTSTPPSRPHGRGRPLVPIR